MFNPEGHEVNRVLRSSALSYLRTLTSESAISKTATNKEIEPIEASQKVVKPVPINKNLQRSKWLLTAIADLVFCRYSQSDLEIDGDEIKGFSNRSQFLGSSSDALKNAVLELANRIRIELQKQKKWNDPKSLNRKDFLASITPTVVDELMHKKSASNPVFSRMELEHHYNSNRGLRDVIEIIWNRTSSDTNQMDTQPWYTAWILQPKNERRIEANVLLHQAISDHLSQFEKPLSGDTQVSTNTHLALIVKEACQLAQDPKDSIEILSSEFNTILVYEFDTSGCLGTQEFIGVFQRELKERIDKDCDERDEQDFSTDDESDFSNDDESDFSNDDESDFSNDDESDFSNLDETSN